MELKVTKIGNSLGVILPRDLLIRMRLDNGDSVFITETPDGFKLSAYDEQFAAQMETARTLMRKRRNVLQELAK